jgi:dienelactone hydrolase
MQDLTPFDYEHDGVVLKAQIARPAGPGPHPAVLVMHDALGIGGAVFTRARDLAQLGYVAVATEMYGTGRREMESGEAFLAMQEDAGLLRGRALAGLEAARALPEVDKSRISAIGFCFGGQCVLELARSGADLASVVSFHGVLTTQRPAEPGAVKAKVLVLTGALDPYAPIEHVAAFEQEMAAAEADWHLTVYGQAYHAFTDPEISAKYEVPGTKYDPRIDRLSWAQATAFMAEFGPR